MPWRADHCWSEPIETSLFRFIWTYSKVEQIKLLVVTLLLFPFLYLTLELPKRIINDAIGATQDSVTVLGYDMSQMLLLAVLCGGFLLAVLAHGLLKMRINTMKGVLAERMLRRFRFQLVNQLFRFPKSYFQRTSQAEIVSMVTSESEPLGGMMGDAISQPILQAGQMLTILGFLFLQSFWFGLAAIALIPLQAWLIPMLQRQINKLNKQRIQEVRKLAAEIGETAAGASELRTTGGHRYRAALVTNRLGKLFFIRFEIYKKKFFMKFLNNFINQLTPFFFFSIGGYLVILGHVSLGALVAALAAYKDLSSPWKELLAYYTRYHEQAQRWTLITERFAPGGRLDETLLTGRSEQVERLTGDIRFEAVSARDADGIEVLRNLDLTLPAGGTIGIAARNDEDRRAMAELLTRELLPSEGRITIGGRDLATLHQATLGARIGVADSQPYLFAGTIRDNLMLPLQAAADPVALADPSLDTDRTEADRSGNSIFLAQDGWMDPELAGFASLGEVEAWWLRIVEGIGVDQDLVRQGLRLTISGAGAPKLTQQLVELRDEVQRRLDGDGLAHTVIPFRADAYCTALPLIHNILHAIPRVPVTPEMLAADPGFLELLRERALIDDLFDVARSKVTLLHSTFGSDGTDHPLFLRLGIPGDTFDAALAICKKVGENDASSVPKDELALLLGLAAALDPTHVGEMVPKELQGKIVSSRTDDAPLLLDGIFQLLDRQVYLDGLTLLENLAFGVVNTSAGPRVDMLTSTVAGVLAEHGMKPDVAMLTLGEETLLGGTNLPAKVRERVSFTRAVIKKPDIFVLNRALGSYDVEARISAARALREAMPQATIIYLENEFENPEVFDLYVELHQGTVSTGAPTVSEPDTGQDDSTTDLATKLQALEQTVFFSGVERKQLRLLAFSAKWFEIPAGEVVFHKNDDPSDGVYLVQEGEADFYAPLADGSEVHIRTVGPGSLVGELALILGEPRTLTMRARTDLRGLRIGGEEFLSVMHNDARTTFKLMQLVAGYLSKVPE